MDKKINAIAKIAPRASELYPVLYKTGTTYWPKMSSAAAGAGLAGPSGFPPPERVLFSPNTSMIPIPEEEPETEQDVRNKSSETKNKDTLPSITPSPPSREILKLGDQKTASRIINYEQRLNRFLDKTVSPKRLESFPLNNLDLVNTFYELSVGENPLSVIQWKVNPSPIKENLFKFVKMPCPIGYVMECRVVRHKGQFYMHLEVPGEKGILMMTAVGTDDGYSISIDATELAKDANPSIGKLRANFWDNQYSLFDNEKKPKLGRRGRASGRQDKTREDLGAIIYEWPDSKRTNRFVRIIVPSMKSEFERMEHHPRTDDATILARTRMGYSDGVIELETSESLGGKGREIVLSSIKNMNIVHRNANKSYNTLRFGRTARNAFNLDFRYPLCPLQAFAIVLTSFSKKIIGAG